MINVLGPHTSGSHLGMYFYPSIWTHVLEHLGDCRVKNGHGPLSLFSGPSGLLIPLVSLLERKQAFLAAVMLCGAAAALLRPVSSSAGCAVSLPLGNIWECLQTIHCATTTRTLLVFLCTSSNTMKHPTTYTATSTAKNFLV